MKTKLIYALMLGALMITSCKKDKKDPEPTNNNNNNNPTPTYTVPTAYTFSNVSYTGQTQRMDMLAELKTYMSTGNNSLTVLSAQKMKEMYANQNNQFANSALNTAGKDIKSKVFSLDQNIFETYMDNLAASSTATTLGSQGVAGVVISPSQPSKKYLCDANGVEWTQVIEKGLMGALLYYQTTAVYLDESKIGNSVDNNSVTAGQGTAMEHHWDEAFGYFGVPNDFPAVTTGIRFWGKYCNDRNAVMGCNATIMNAFLKGRAAISNKDYATRDAQVVIVRDTWEKVIVGTIISYVNSTKQNMTDDAVRNHNCSEIKGFLMNLKYNPTKKITLTQLAQLESYLGNNYYTITTTNLDNIKNELSTIYGLDNIKNSL
jgi:hypothetical protein